MVFINIALKFLLISMFMMPLAMASDVFTVNNVAVDMEGKNAIDAKGKALTQARRNAFEIVMKRITAEDRVDHWVNTSDSAITSMVNNFEINREKLSKNRYLASVNVTFNERALKAYFDRDITDLPLDNTNTALNNPYYDTSQTPLSNNSNYRIQDEMDITRTGVVPLQAFVMRADISGIRYWIDLKNKLSIIPSVKRVSVQQLSSKRVVLQLDYDGEPKDLQQDLITRGLRLYTNNMRQTEFDAPYILARQG